MRISQSALPWIRTAILLVFSVVFLGFYLYFYIGAGGRFPFLAPEPYQVTFQSPINKNAVVQSQVTLNGVPVGRVQEVETVNGLGQITVGLNDAPEYAPLHEGASAVIKTKTLINETYVDITDGNGPPIPSNTVLPPGNVSPPVDTDEVVRALPPQDRDALSGAIQSLAVATENNQSGISQTIGSLGEPTNFVPAALEALVNQEAALRQLSTNTGQVLAALDTGSGQIAQLVENSELVTRTTAGTSQELADTLRTLTPTLQTAQNVSGDLSRLGFALQPVADNLNRSAGPLNAALAELPATARDLRGLLPFLDSTLDKLPPTLERVPPVAQEVRDFVPNFDGALDQLNPILAYLRPCGPNIVTFVNFGRAVNGMGADGPLGRVNPIVGLDSINFPGFTPLQFSYEQGNAPLTMAQDGSRVPALGAGNDRCNTPLPPYTR